MEFQKRRSKKVFSHLSDIVLDNYGLLLFEIMPSLISRLNEISLLFNFLFNVFLEDVKVLTIVFAKNRSLEILLLERVYSVFACEFGICLHVVNSLQLLSVRRCHLELFHWLFRNGITIWELNWIYNFFNQNLSIVGGCGSLRGHRNWDFFRV